jgi:hypothetical protein
MEYEDNLNYQGSIGESGGRHTILSLRKASVQIPMKSDDKRSLDKTPVPKQKVSNGAI